MNYLLKNARVIDPSRGIDSTGDIAVENGTFVEPSSLSGPCETLDLRGLVAAPGFTDVHVHLRQPGKTAAETVRTGTMAAAAGGFTNVVAMPNTSPCADNPGTIQLIRNYAEKEGVVNVLLSGAMTKNIAGEEMAGIGSLKNAGVVALTDDGKCVQNHELMRHIMEYAGSFGLPIMDHCQDKILAADGVMHDGYWSVLLGMRGMCAEAEELIIARNIMLCRRTGCRIHMQHVSSKGSVQLVREARAEKLPVTCEATPHHIALTDVEIKKFDSNYKMNPPLRSEEDRQEILRGLADGTITIIATDHAPHTETEKAVEFDYAPFGIIGLETAVPVCMTELVHQGILTLPRLIEKFTSGPRELLGLDIGTLRPGAAANLTVLDPEREFVVDPKTFRSKSRNTPFGGYHAKGCAVGTMVKGKFVYSADKAIKIQEN